MTATPILEYLARDFKSNVDHVRNALEMIDAGLTAPFIGRYRRPQVGALSESLIRRLDRRRQELEELDRRKGTILRLLEKEENVPASVLEHIRTCMDRFEVEDLFLPHRRPEPEVQLALDRGLGALADELLTPLQREPRPEGEAKNAPEQGESSASEAAMESVVESSPEAEAEAGEPVEETAVATAEAPAETVAEAPSAKPSEETTTPATEVADEPAPEVAAEAVVEPAAEFATESTPESLEGAQPDAASEAPAEPAPAPAEAETPPTPAPTPATTGGQAAPPQVQANLELARICRAHVSPDRGVHNENEALAGAMRIISDRLGRSSRLRGTLRRMLRKHGTITVRPLVDESKAGRHRSLLKLNQPMRQIQGNRLLAIRQAQKERVLTTRISIDRAQALQKVRATLGKNLNPAVQGVIDEVCARALDRRLLPMIEEDVRLELKERADAEAMRFLAQHLRQLLLTPVLPRRLTVVGVDVTAKGDWVVAAVNGNGELVTPTEIRLEARDKDAATLGAALAAALAEFRIEAASVSSSKSSRAALLRVREAFAVSGLEVFTFVVTEAGLSSHANSEIARKEHPECSISQRIAISLARRLQDPLSELLKVDPRHLSLGSEQGLVSKANVRRTFKETVESCVAHVGCDVNHAPVHFLAALPGLNKATAERIVARRAETPIGSREELRDEGLVDEAQWASAIGFLRVHGSPEPLDRSNLHPEQYVFARQLIESVGSTVEEGIGRMGITKGLRREDFDIDPDTWRDLMRELAHPGRDPRLRLHRPELLAPDTDPATLTKDRVIEGILSNVTSFGAFVDVGLTQDAMIHISEVSDHYVRDARELLSVGQVVRARILDSGGQRMTLSLKNVPREIREKRDGGGRGRRDSRGRTGGGRGRDDRPRVDPNLRAAQTRRDGLAGTSSGGPGGRRGPGGGRGGPGGGRGGPGARGDRRRGRDDGDERVDLRKVNKDLGKVVNNPFAAFFSDTDAEAPAKVEKPVEAQAEQPVQPKSEAPVEPPVEPKVEAQVEPPVEPKVEAQVEPPVEPKVESQAEPPAEQKTEE